MKRRIALLCLIVACIAVILAVSIGFVAAPILAPLVVVPLAIAYVLGEVGVDVKS